MRYLQSFVISFFIIIILFLFPFPNFIDNSNKVTMNSNLDMPPKFTLTNYSAIPEKSEMQIKDTLIKENKSSQDNEKINYIDNNYENNEDRIQESKLDNKQLQTTKNNMEAIVKKSKSLIKQINDDSPDSASDIIDYTPDFSKNKKPLYPIAAKRMRQQGQTKLEILLDRLGNIINVAVKKSSGYLLLDEAAVKAAKQWDLSSAIQLGKNTRVHTTITFTLRKRTE